MLLACFSMVSADDGPLAQDEPQWIQLFDGESLDGWTPKIRGYELGEDPKGTFRVEDGLLKVCYDEYDEFGGEFGHLFYEEPFSSYILRLEYRFVGEQTPGGPGWAFRNSGAMLHGQAPETMGIDQDFPVSIEAQLLGGSGEGERSTANVCTPGTNIVLDGELWTQHCTNSESATYHGDQWVTVELEVHGSDEIIHRVEGEEVLRYESPQLDPGDGNAAALIEAAGGEVLLSEGYISLQAESHPLEFRRVELLPLE
jgi:hypothetical protein